MRTKTRAQVDNALQETGKATAELQKVQAVTRQEIDDIAKKYSGEKSSFLAGVVGGVAGAAGGIALHGALGALIVVTGPAGAALGVALAVLAWRGTSHWKLERATERVTTALDKIRAEATKPQTPPEVKAQLWAGYRQIMSEYMHVAAGAVGESEISRPSPPASPMLPAFIDSTGKEGQPAREEVVDAEYIDVERRTF